MRLKTAVIDIGSNTIRLVIYDYEVNKGMKEVENIKTVARLRGYLTPTNEMREEGIQLLITTLEGFKEIIEHHKITDLRIAATAAIRQAANSHEIIQRVRIKTNFEISILTEEEEAYYGFLAVVHSTPVLSGITIDMGGGSTEITYFEQKQLKYSHSFPFGVVSLKKEFMKNEVLTALERAELTEFLNDQFRSLPWLENKKVPIVAIGGSARNIAQIDQQLKAYPIAGVHQYWMSKESLFSLRNQIIDMDYNDLEKLEGLSNDRIDIIAPASQVFCQLFDTVQATGFLFSRKGLRDGLVLKELMNQLDAPLNKEHVFQNSLKELFFDYSITKQNAEQIKFIAEQLYYKLTENGVLAYSHEDLELLKKASCLYYLGEYIDSDSSSEHTFYILANRSIDGVLHEDRVKIAAIASFKSKSAMQQYLRPFDKWFTKEEIQSLRELGALLKFAYSLNGSKRNIIKKIEINNHLQELEIILYAAGNTLAEENQAEKQKKHLAKAVKQPISLTFIQLRKDLHTIKTLS
ncbi:Ppx/GppA family phosphatase [Jeotgalibacillus sp. S-D1]|uniref:Ppx/GppA family phosphatase n=1 Tax=Jeotgalibacillus sp. S-D1 TaxID=2552189 RepID=UPI00105A9976|nr:Ppx/GppA family phosphatase [Jeotgalibacillus sp. S-D1]TDL35214.1 Ppx/GppA family phosphatase [Jeotgalibacillus sp. S-D1]